uniref:Uncharacterized protein n=1 Tax=Chelydra serpentina TaxID=8475 RepID=A0A8C3S3P7_CHESE
KLPLYSPGIALKGPKQKQPNWKQSKGSSPSLGVLTVPSPAATLEPTDYLERYKRALQSQVSPGLTLWLRKATTKEVGVQVNPQVDPRAPQPTSAWRPRLSTHPGWTGASSRCPRLPSLRRRRRHRPWPWRGRRELMGSRRHGSRKRNPARGTREWTPPPPSSRSRRRLRRHHGEKGPPRRRDPPSRWQVMTEIFLFQFLEQKYGYFHYKDCKTRWESSYVWCISGGNNWVLYDIDLKRPRQELGGHCKSKRLSRDNTYRFKYIV